MSDKPLSAVDEIMELVVEYGDLRRDGRYADSTIEWGKIRLELVKLTGRLAEREGEIRGLKAERYALRRVIADEGR